MLPRDVFSIWQAFHRCSAKHLRLPVIDDVALLELALTSYSFATHDTPVVKIPLVAQYSYPGLVLNTILNLIASHRPQPAHPKPARSAYPNHTYSNKPSPPLTLFPVPISLFPASTPKWRGHYTPSSTPRGLDTHKMANGYVHYHILQPSLYTAQKHRLRASRTTCTDRSSSSPHPDTSQSATFVTSQTATATSSSIASPARPL